MDLIIKCITDNKICVSLIVIVVGFIIYTIIKKMVDKFIEKNKNNEKITKKKRTYIRLLKNVLKYIMLIIVIITVLQVNGINVTSIIAGLGMVSIIAGLALQDALKDIIMGFNIIMDDYFSVGDVIKVGAVEGKVVELGLKATKMKDVNNENIFVIANRNIGESLVLSNQLDIDVPLPYEEDTNKIEGILESVVEEISSIKNVLSVSYKGINDFGDSAIFYKIRIFCKPENKPQVKRDANKIIKIRLDENSITIPYTQLVIHKGE